MKELVKQRLLYFFKIAVGLSLVIVILSRVDSQKVVEYFSSLHISLLGMITVLSLISLIIQFLRWRYLVHSNSESFDIRDVLPAFLAGFAFRLMVPGGHAEISKIFLMPGRKRGKAIAFGIEKFFQTYIKILLIFAVLPLTFSNYKWVSLSVVTGMLIFFIIFPRLKWLKMAQEKTVNNYKLFGVTFLYSMGIFAVMVLQYWLLLNTVHEISLTETAHVIVYIWGAGVVPISISGLGIREGLAVYFLKFYGFPPAYAVSTSLFLFFLNIIIPALAGVYFIYKKHSHLKDIKSTVRSTTSLLKMIKNGKPEQR